MSNRTTPLTNTMILVERKVPGHEMTYVEATGGAWGVPAEALALATARKADEDGYDFDYFDRFGIRTIGVRTVDVATRDFTDTII